MFTSTGTQNDDSKKKIFLQHVWEAKMAVGFVTDARKKRKTKQQQKKLEIKP